MGRSRMFAAFGVSVALLLGATAAPAVAKSDNSNAEKPAPKPKKSKAGVSGGGAVNGGEFSIQARAKNKAKANHFNYTAEGFKLRCRPFDYKDSVVLTPATVSTPPTASLKTSNCMVTKADGSRVKATVDATFVDNGNPPDDEGVENAAPGPDTVGFTVTDEANQSLLAVPASLVTGNVKIRF